MRRRIDAAFSPAHRNGMLHLFYALHAGKKDRWHTLPYETPLMYKTLNQIDMAAC